jgi:hypothetical protein
MAPFAGENLNFFSLQNGFYEKVKSGERRWKAGKTRHER